MKYTLPLAAIMVACGCSMIPGIPQPMPVPAYFAPRADVDRVQRVMVLPFQSAQGVEGSTDDLREAFIAELAKLQRFEVIPLPHGAREDTDLYASLNRGRISTEALASLGERYALDGVLLATVTGYRPYKPPHLGLRAQLVSLHSATAVWAAEAFYDSGDAATIEDIRHFTQSYLADQESMHGWEIALISPKRFASFVSHRIVGTWRYPTYARPD